MFVNLVTVFVRSVRMGCNVAGLDDTDTKLPKGTRREDSTAHQCKDR